MTISKEFNNIQEAMQFLKNNKIRTCERKQDKINNKIIIIYNKI